MAKTPEQIRKRDRLAQRKWRENNLDRSRATNRKSARKQRDRDPEKWNASQRARHLRNPAVMLLAKAKYRAKVTSTPFAITADDVRVPTHCPLLGVELKTGSGKLGPASPTLDKIVPALGYVPGNVWVVSMRANQLKNNFTLEQMEHFAAVLRRRMLAIS